MRSVELIGNTVRMIDQKAIPREFRVLELTDYRQVAGCIRDLTVRGAPAIGVSAAFALVLAADELVALDDPQRFMVGLEEAADLLRSTRPTAVNLFWAIDRVMRRARRELEVAGPADAAVRVAAAVRDEAQRMADEDVEVNRRLGACGQELIRDGFGILTHCNAGSLATVDYGTAVGVIRAAHEVGKKIHVFVDETRPVLQGARLTAWEMVQLGIPATLITDNMAAHFMKAGRLQFAVVGADRVAANGDVANKIGTYGVAVLCREHGIPFYVAAPISTVDLSISSGDQIVIEERRPDEVTHLGGVRIAPEGINVANPAFDVTPHRYVTGIITERGVIYPPYDLNVPRVAGRIND